MRGRAWLTKLFADLAARTSEVNCVGFVVDNVSLNTVAYPGIFFGGRGGSTNSVEDRGQTERRSGGGSTLVRGSEGSCNLVHKFHFI